jgi:hypothetical protein
MDDLYSKKSQAVDWSDKFVQNNTITFSYLAAQNNILKYKDDDDVSTNGSGIIVEQNETLPIEATLFEMAFSATDETGRYNYADIRQWEKDFDNDTFEFNEVNPRICYVDSNAGRVLSLQFNDLAFNKIIPRFYTRYQETVKKPVILECTLRLNELDLKNLDFSTPVYFKQLGKYYGIITIQNTDNISKAKLIQL